MQYYLAPMEGITTYIYRSAHAKYFGGIDKYFTPFISDKNFITDKNSNKSLNAKELRDILPENNAGIALVPQVLTNNAKRFLAVAKEISSYGYDTVNLNLGCPSGTVTAKKRGAGFLSVPDELDAFLYEVYDKCPLKISVKTRLGVSDLSEWDNLLDIYAKYPVHELIIHTRLLKEFYTGDTHPEAYAKAVIRLQANDAAGNHSQIPLCYNGDIISAKSLEDAVTALNTDTRDSQNMTKSATIDCVMIGRGIIQNPALARQLPSSRSEHVISKEIWRAFHDEILSGYIKIMSGDSPSLFKMKDLWTYMSRSFTNSEKYLKRIRKANRISDYVNIVDGLFREQEIIV
ncbi:MAG: tRNA-dihydrouridine synthase family protein [Lachnospiraceae bacterium]|nr:tRNA-dihydrouridine synthase family protein [Lachnospiraceae bacterium]